jgi:hypothetical protein
MIPEVTKPAEKIMETKGMSTREKDKKKTKQIRAEVLGVVSGAAHFSYLYVH